MSLEIIGRRYKKMENILKYLSTYEKNPPEIIKDDFAYDRLMNFIHEQCRIALED